MRVGDRCADSIRSVPNRHDTGSTTARSVDEVELIRDSISHYAPVLIAPLSIRIRRAGVHKIRSPRRLARRYRARNGSVK